MRIEGAGNWLVGFALLPKPGVIIVPSTKGITRIYLLESVGSDAAAAGYKAGDLIVAERGVETYPLGRHTVSLTCDKAMYWVRDVPLSEFVYAATNEPVEPQKRANGDAAVAGAPV